MHRVDEDAKMLGIDVGRNAMAEIEDVSRAVTIACEHVGDTLADRSGWFAQRRRVEIALQCDFVNSHRALRDD